MRRMELALWVAIATGCGSEDSGRTTGAVDAGHDGGGGGGDADSGGVDAGEESSWPEDSAPETAPDGPGCGDDTCADDESCATCPEDCGACDPGPCTSEGGRACGGNGIDGDPNTLYVCTGGEWSVDHACGGPCEPMPSGVPDRCPSDLTVPQSLVDAIDAKPYVEVDCLPGSYPGWPFDAKECTYTAGGITANVTVANPSSDRVAAWIVDASTWIPTLWNLKWESQPDYEAGLIVIGTAMMMQSSRIFPLHGGIIENMGGGYEIYPFDKGVTEGCSSGCYCRINSLHRTEWCGYQEFMGVQSSPDCLDEVGQSGLTPAWGDRCLQNHVDAWTSSINEHFRAKAWKANQTVRAACSTYGACTPDEVVAAVEKGYN